MLSLAGCVPSTRSAELAPVDPATPAAASELADTRWQALRERADAIGWTDETRERFVAALPKIETHLHLDGALSPKTIAALAQDQGYAPLMDRSEAEIAALTVVDTPREDLATVLEAFFTIYPLLHTPEALETVSYDLIANAHEQQIRYLEVRFAPVLQAVPEQGFTIEAVLEAVLAGLERGRRDFGVESAVIVCLFRPLPVEVNATMLEAAIAFKDRGVVGIDLAGDESEVPLTTFADLYRQAGDAGLYRTVHAGEVADSDDLALAVELGVDRIGHARYLDADPALLEEVQRRGIALEINLTSNHRTGAIATLAEHPAKRWFDAGVAINVSTDDPGVFGITLTGEYLLLIQELGFSVGDLIELQRRTIATLFMSEADKRRLEARMLADIEALLDAV
ncbi:Adenosine deaminase [Enhygromyxa salina]|uniref:adenosine deaminase n=1 Tax=Enhygromyxa salina TaxID=215803 RepID=A0A0C2D837_9BACT|nr:Adenosine deaminase [Enhygromyxa salina]